MPTHINAAAVLSGFILVSRLWVEAVGRIARSARLRDSGRRLLTDRAMLCPTPHPKLLILLIF
jgi:hypothetical protein